MTKLLGRTFQIIAYWTGCDDGQEKHHIHAEGRQNTLFVTEYARAIDDNFEMANGSPWSVSSQENAQRTLSWVLSSRSLARAVVLHGYEWLRATSCHARRYIQHVAA